MGKRPPYSGNAPVAGASIPPRRASISLNRAVILPIFTISRCSFGISRPMQVLPGITSTTRKLTVDSDRARSLAKAGDAAGLDTGRRLQSEARDDRSRMNGDDLDVEIPESHQGRKACTVVGILAAVAASASAYRLHGVNQHAFLELSIAIALLIGLDL